MADLNAADRKAMPSDQFALPGKRFPMPDAEHARLALSGATRAQKAGDISASEAAIVRAKANRMLNRNALRDTK